MYFDTILHKIDSKNDVPQKFNLNLYKNKKKVYIIKEMSKKGKGEYALLKKIQIRKH